MLYIYLKDNEGKKDIIKLSLNNYTHRNGSLFDEINHKFNHNFDMIKKLTKEKKIKANTIKDYLFQLSVKDIKIYSDAFYFLATKLSNDFFFKTALAFDVCKNTNHRTNSTFYPLFFKVKKEHKNTFIEFIKYCYSEPFYFSREADVENIVKHFDENPDIEEFFVSNISLYPDEIEDSILCNVSFDVWYDDLLSEEFQQFLIDNKEKLQYESVSDIVKKYADSKQNFYDTLELFYKQDCFNADFSEENINILFNQCDFSDYRKEFVPLNSSEEKQIFLLSRTLTRNYRECNIDPDSLHPTVYDFFSAFLFILKFNNQESYSKEDLILIATNIYKDTFSNTLISFYYERILDIFIQSFNISE